VNPEPGETIGRHRAAEWVPQRKVTSGAFGGALAVLILWVIGLSGVEIPPEVASAVTGLVVAGVAYLVPSPA
jgi:hypothetical protein